MSQVKLDALEGDDLVAVAQASMWKGLEVCIKHIFKLRVIGACDLNRVNALF